MRRLLWIPLVLLLLPPVLLVVLALVPGRWLADRAERIAADRFDLDLEIGELSLDVFSWTPGLALSGTSLAASGQAPLAREVDLAVGLDLRALFGGTLVLDRVVLSDARLTLSIDESGQGNWASLIPPSDDEAPSTDGQGGIPLPAVREIAIANVRVDHDDAARRRTLSATLSASGSTTDAARPTLISASGELDGLPLALDAELAALGALSASLDALALEASASLGDARAAVEGAIGDPSTLAALDLNVEFAAEGTADLSTALGLPLPELPPFTVRGELAREGEEFVLRRFDGTFGDSDVGGDIRVDPSGAPPTLNANVISRRLDLDDLAVLFGGLPDPGESATPEQEAKTAAAADDTKLLPDTALNLAPLTKAFDGVVRYRAERVESPRYPLDSIDVRVEVGGERLTVPALEVGLAGGLVSGALGIDVAPAPPEGSLELRVSRVDLRELMRALEIDDDSLGTIGGEAKFWFAGDSVAAFADTLDGGLYLLMTGGRLDALLAELAGLDLVESIALLIDPDKTLSEIGCAYLDLQVADGIAEIERFVLDSDDTLFVADGRIDLGEESFDLALEPHPKDTTLLGSQTSVRVSGHVGDIRVVPGKELPLRAAAAAALATLAAPLAAVLPFVESGSAPDSPYCDGLVDALDEAG